MTDLIAALTAGAVTSLHCAGMCGPLACLASGASPLETRNSKLETATRARRVLLYHAGRATSYAALGALAGALGQTAAAPFQSPLARLLPWAFILLFLLVFLGWEKSIRPPAWLAAKSRSLWTWLAQPRGPASSFYIGLGTPLLPCGPLYIILGAMLVSGSALAGASLMAAFALGTSACLLLLQLNLGWLQTRLSPARLRALQRSLALVALVLMVLRASKDMALFSTPTSPCCH